jgi:hypothetical protein
MTTKLELKSLLFDTYGGFADQRYKKIENDAPFIVDDRGRGDYDARGQLFLWFCQMFAFVEEADLVRLSLISGVPQSDAVSQWYAEHGADEQTSGFLYTVEIDVTPDNLDDLPDLANRFAAIIKRRYDVCAYKYVVPRTCGSLMRFHGVLSKAWR